LLTTRAFAGPATNPAAKRSLTDRTVRRVLLCCKRTDWSLSNPAQDDWARTSNRYRLAVDTP
jgi:hypothetical protein